MFRSKHATSIEFVFVFEELDDETRAVMLAEFRAEEASIDPGPYRPRNPGLTDAGLAIYTQAIEEALAHGNGETLAEALAHPPYWNLREEAMRGGRPFVRHHNPAALARRFGVTQFNTWYVRALARRLAREDIEVCEIYEAEKERLAEQCPDCAGSTARGLLSSTLLLVTGCATTTLSSTGSI